MRDELLDPAHAARERSLEEPGHAIGAIFRTSATTSSWTSSTIGTPASCSSISAALKISAQEPETRRLSIMWFGCSK